MCNDVTKTLQRKRSILFNDFDSKQEKYLNRGKILEAGRAKIFGEGYEKSENMLYQ